MKINNFTFLILELTLVVLVSATPTVPRNVNPQPRDVESSDVTFRLYTAESPDVYRTIQTGQLQNDSLDASRPFKFIIHGYTHDADKSWVTDMKDEYMKNANGPYNVIAVDWSEPASEINYFESAENTEDVGRFLALLVIDLHDTLGVPYENIHLVGHSLGAQVSGFCGQYIRSTVNNTLIGRITGMDPAGPAFILDRPDSRLSPDDASFVDVIHTDGDVLGYLNECGHVDFYPNGGLRLQPGCLTRDSWLIACSHCRAFEFMTESINSLGFVAKECSNYINYRLGLCRNNQVAIMGENVDQSLRGEFHLTTNWRSPFAEN